MKRLDKEHEHRATPPPPTKSLSAYRRGEMDVSLIALLDGRSLWLRDIVHPLIVGVMVGCVALSIVQLARLFFPDWNRLYLVIAPIAAALISQYSWRIERASRRSGADLLKFQIIELATFFLVLTVLRYWGWSWQELITGIQKWMDGSTTLVDIQLLTAFILMLVAWAAARETAHDLELVAAPPITWEGEPPMDTLARRFLNGGMILLVFTGLARVGIAALLNMERPPIPGIILNVLIYFMLGIVMLGQVRFTWLLKTWRAQDIAVAPELPTRWIQYSLLFIGAALLLAFVLPTSYTVGLLDIIVYLIVWLYYIFWTILAIALLPLAWLFSLLQGKNVRDTEPPLELRPPPPPPPNTDANMPWLEIVRSIIFWVVATGIVFYIIRSYFRERPQLLTQLRAQRPVKWLRQLWTILLSWWRGVRRVVEIQVSRISLRGLRGASLEGGLSFLRHMGHSPRERVMYYYLELLDRAGELGFTRQKHQTPYEYRGTLEPSLAKAQQEMAEVTQVFVEARYSQHDVVTDDVARARADAERVRAALETRCDEAEDNEDESSL